MRSSLHPRDGARYIGSDSVHHVASAAALPGGLDNAFPALSPRIVAFFVASILARRIWSAALRSKNTHLEVSGLMRSWIMDRSNSAKASSIWNNAFPAGVVGSDQRLPL
jgi:hypothetical protein